MAHTRMNDEERERLLQAAMDAEAAGDSAAAEDFLRQIPVSPGMAMELKRAVGSETMRRLNLNYADVEEKYGPGWLDT